MGVIQVSQDAVSLHEFADFQHNFSQDYAQLFPVFSLEEATA
jgi:hypothetical protein